MMSRNQRIKLTKRWYRNIKMDIKNGLICDYILMHTYSKIALEMIKMIEKYNMTNNEIDMRDYIESKTIVHVKNFIPNYANFINLFNRNRSEITERQFRIYETMFQTKHQRLNIVNFDKFLFFNFSERDGNEDFESIVRSIDDIMYNIYALSGNKEAVLRQNLKGTIESYAISAIFKELKENLFKKILMHNECINSFANCLVDMVLNESKLK